VQTAMQPAMQPARVRIALTTGLITSIVLAGCSSTPGADPTPPTTASTTAATSTSSDGSPSGRPVPGISGSKTLATGLEVPWGVAFLADGSALVSERPTGRVVRVGADGGTTPVGTVPGVADQGEGGLLGLAVLPVKAPEADATVYAYLTSTSHDNRVLRMTFDGSKLSGFTPILTGIPSAGIHNGGLVKVGPDGKLWIGTGEAGRRSPAQDRSDLGGKILRINPDGSIPSDNPFPGSAVYSLGHRNVQGLAFDSHDQPWAVEFGQNTWDELNRIVPGGNYGWPEVEGKQAKAGFIEPLVQWPTDDASPSGMAIVDDVAYIGGLRGERLWQVPLNGDTTGTPKAYLHGQFGRIRNVAAAPDGTLWITTSNRDGRGSPGPGDDKVIRLTLG
jgi:glucose/arabinose dehydrogenase